jgi:putative intracellular protease/amidase
MTQIVHLALVETLADWEVGYLTAHLRNGQFQRQPGAYDVRTVALTAEPVTTMGGLRVLPDLTLDRLRPEDSAMLVLPGAETWDGAENAAFVAKAQEFLAAGTPVAAMCGATYALAAAGLLDERPHTSNDAGFLASSGYAGAAHYVEEPVVTDGDLITATGVAPVHFARAVFERLGSHEPAVLESWTKLYLDRDPAGYYGLMETVEA